MKACFSELRWYYLRRKARLCGATIVSYKDPNNRKESFHFQNCQPLYSTEAQCRNTIYKPKDRGAACLKWERTPGPRQPHPFTPFPSPTFRGAPRWPQGTPDPQEGQSNKKKFNSQIKSTKGRKAHSSSLFLPFEIKKEFCRIFCVWAGETVWKNWEEEIVHFNWNDSGTTTL